MVLYQPGNYHEQIIIELLLFIATIFIAGADSLTDTSKRHLGIKKLSHTHI